MLRNCPQRVLVVYPFMPHYRYGIFKAMDESTRFDYTFASDPVGVDGIEPLATTAVRIHHPLKTRRSSFGIWQSGLLRLAVMGHYDTYVFLGDASHLSTWISSAIVRLRRKRVLFWTIGWHAPERGPKKLIRLVFYHLANELLLYGNIAKAIGVRLGYPAQRMTVIHNSHSIAAPVKSGKQMPPLDLEVLVSDHPIIGAIVRLNRAKRLDLLIRAAGELGRRGKPVTVVLAGDGPLAGELLALAKTNDVDLRLLGSVYSESDIAAIYSCFALSVVPSAVGLTAIQSLSHGVPVISDDSPYTQMPEWEAIVQGVTGGHFRAGDYEDLANEIAQWLDRSEESTSSTREACIAEVRARWHPDAQLPILEATIGGGDR